MADHPEEFDAFYAAWAPRTVRHIYLATGDQDRAQECAQKAFLRAWRRWDALAADADPVSWVRTVAWQLAVDDWRTRARQFRALVRHGAESDLPPPSADVVAVRTALARLPRDQQIALVLFHFEDLSVRVVAEIVGAPEGTVKARLSRGRDALAVLLADEEPTWTR